MSGRVIVDTDAIVATLNKRDQWHAVAAPRFLELPKPFYTCESVVSEACFRVGRRRLEVIGLIANGLIKVSFSLGEEIEAVNALMNKYANVPMSLADACLVRMSELWTDSIVFTLDSDFRIYGKNRRQMINTVPLS